MCVQPNARADFWLQAECPVLVQVYWHAHVARGPEEEPAGQPRPAPPVTSMEVLLSASCKLFSKAHRCRLPAGSAASQLKTVSFLQDQATALPASQVWVVPPPVPQKKGAHCPPTPPHQQPADRTPAQRHWASCYDSLPHARRRPRRRKPWPAVAPEPTATCVSATGPGAARHCTAAKLHCPHFSTAGEH